MAEALWTSNAGVEFAASEDRRLIGAIWSSGGALNGLTATPGSGRSVSISAGRAVVPDGTNGAYLAYFDSATVDLALQPNTGAARKDGVFVVVDDPGTGLATIVIGVSNVAPTDPNIRIATVVVDTNATTIPAGNINNTVRTSPLDARYLTRDQLLYGPASALPAALPIGVTFMVHE